MEDPFHGSVDLFPSLPHHHGTQHLFGLICLQEDQICLETQGILLESMIVKTTKKILMTMVLIAGGGKEGGGHQPGNLKENCRGQEDEQERKGRKVYQQQPAMIEPFLFKICHSFG